MKKMILKTERRIQLRNLPRRLRSRIPIPGIGFGRLGLFLRKTLSPRSGEAFGRSPFRFGKEFRLRGDPGAEPRSRGARELEAGAEEVSGRPDDFPAFS